MRAARERARRRHGDRDRKSTRLNSSHTEIYTLSLHDALPIFTQRRTRSRTSSKKQADANLRHASGSRASSSSPWRSRSEEHTSELQSHRDLHSFPTRRSSDLHPTKNQVKNLIEEASGCELETCERLESELVVAMEI